MVWLPYEGDCPIYERSLGRYKPVLQAFLARPYRSSRSLFCSSTGRQQISAWPIWSRQILPGPPVASVPSPFSGIAPVFALQDMAKQTTYVFSMAGRARHPLRRYESTLGIETLASANWRICRTSFGL